MTDQDNDHLQHLETVACCYSCCIWRCFLDKRSENHGAHQLFTKGILYQSVPLMWAFSLLLPFVVFFPHSFCSATPSVCPVLVKPVCSFMAPSASTFTLCTFHLASKTTEWYASLSQSNPRFLDVCQTVLEQQHDLFCAQISTVYTLLALLREDSKDRDRHGENILSIYRILAARHISYCQWCNPLCQYEQVP